MCCIEAGAILRGIQVVVPDDDGAGVALVQLFEQLTRTYYHKYRLYTIRGIISRWAPSCENDTRGYVENVSRLTGIDPDEPIGIPSEKPSRWMMVGVAMAIQENGTSSIDYFAMLRGWEMCRQEL